MPDGVASVTATVADNVAAGRTATPPRELRVERTVLRAPDGRVVAVVAARP